jgi:drug/metabolite transporter (DMT)-like permease
MTGLWNSAPALLLLTGSMLGLSLPFGKLALEQGVPPLLWALVISLGAGLTLLVFLIGGGRGIRLDAARLRYFVLAAFISYAVPNCVVFTAMPHLGAGYMGIMFTLSPIVTLLLSLLMGVRRPNRSAILGLLIGFAGALVVAAMRGGAGQQASLFWVLLSFVVPVSLALGNIYRTVGWPEGAGPIELASGSHLASASMLLAALFAQGEGAAIGHLADLPLLVAAQVAAAGGMFAVFFRLQQVGGPVYLSQIGYVAAAVGLASGIAFLGESYALPTWLGVILIAAGVAITTRAQT